MDPIITPIVIILGKYALDKGVEMAKEVGPAALEKAKEMFGMVLERVGRKKSETAAEFPEAPETYQKPLEQALDAEVAADAEFAARLKGMLAEYEEAAQAHAAAGGTIYRAELKGSGAIAQGSGAVAAVAGGVAVGGSVRGSTVITGHGNVIGSGSSSHVQVGGIHAGRIEAENVVDGVQVQGVAAMDAAGLVRLARAIEGGGITADQIRAGSVVSGLQFLAGAPPATQGDLYREIAALRTQMQQAIAAGELEKAGDAEDARDALEGAAAELSKPKPDGERVVRKLETVTRILTRAADLAQAAGKVGLHIIRLAPLAAALWKLAEKILGG